MKNLTLLFLTIVFGGFLFQSCNNDKTYAEMKKEEKASIQRYIDNQNINVISFDEFKNKGYETDTAKNEYVLFSDNGVYMQIVNKGGGKALEDGRYEILAKYIEERIQSDGTADTISANKIGSYSSLPDIIKLVKSSNNYNGTFDEENSSMYYYYSSTAVPNGWLVPMPYLTIGRKINDRSVINLIIPHSQGQMDAANYVYACKYEITYQMDSPTE